jgi:hypothetical protein
MSGECEKCNEHALECNCNKITLTIKAPKGIERRECNLCGLLFVYDGIRHNCLLCEINKKESK